VNWRERLVVWSGLDAPRWEVAHLELRSRGIAGRATQVGLDPVAYRLDYELDALEDFVTRRVELHSQGEGWARELVLTHNGDGGWTCSIETMGGDALGSGGAGEGVLDALAEAETLMLGSRL
jgi:hypothetical protein